MLYLLRSRVVVCLVCLLAFSATTSLAQPHPHPAQKLDRLQTLARLGAPLEAQAALQATFAPKKYTVQVLTDPGPPPEYMTFSESVRTYDQGRVAEEVTQMVDFMGGEMELRNAARTTFNYSANQVTRWTWSGTAWTPELRTTYTYNGAGLLTVELEETYDTGTSTWRNEYRYTTTYTNNLPTQFLDESWNGSAWQPTYRTLVSSGNDAVEMIDQRWTGSAWVNQIRTRYAGITLAEIAELQTEIGPLLEFNFAILVPTRRLAEVLFALEYTDEAWNTTTNSWENDTRTRVLTNTASTLTAVNETWSGGAWVGEDRITFTFEGDRTIEQQTETWDGEAFVADSRTAFTYDANGNATLIEAFGDDDEDGTFDAVAQQRTVIEWQDLTGTSVDGDGLIVPARFTAVQPNPTGASTSIGFSLSTAAPVDVRVFDALGREVATLASGMHEAGTHTAHLDASRLPAGIYFVRLQAAGVSATRSLVVAR